MNPMIDIANLTREFEQSGRTSTKVLGLDNVSLSVMQGEFFVLLGPSGSGKTTCLRMLAGLDRPTSGAIAIDGVKVFESESGVWVGPEMRPQAMVFQSYALWPQLTVIGNIEFALRHGARKVSQREATRRTQEVVELLDLGAVSKRKVTLLSGGQQQRVALARALALEPKVLLMDEPLSNLDVELRSRVRDEIKRITSRVGITTVLVTHDQEEAFAVGDKMAILNKGKVEQVGDPEELYRAPASQFVANFLDKMNFFGGVVIRSSSEDVEVRFDGGISLAVPASQTPVGSQVTVGIRPGGYSISEVKGEGMIPARINNRVFLGPIYRYDLETPMGDTVVRTTIEHKCFEGDQVFLSPQRNSMVLLG